MPRGRKINADDGLFSCTFLYCTYSTSNLQNFKRHISAARHHIDEPEHKANRAQGAPQHESAGTDLDTEAQTGLDQAPAMDHQGIDDMKWVLATLQKMSRPWQMSQQMGELLSVYGCSSYTRSRVWHQTRASTSGNWCKQGRREARAPLELLVQDLQLPALPEAPPDAQLLEGGMSAPDSASAAEEDLPTSVKALLGPGKPILPSTQHHAWPHC
jgi:hypothetical protein